MMFHRYGSLNATDYRKSAKKKRNFDNFHNAPTRSGIYAFPIHIDDSFLWAWKYKNLPYDDEKMDDKEYYEEYERRNKKKFQNWARSVHKTFHYNGIIWSHLDTDPQYVIDRCECWVLTSMHTYEKMLKRQYAADLKETLCNWKKDFGGELPDKLRFNPYKPNTIWRTAVDHLEVYIDKKELKKIH